MFGLVVVTLRPGSAWLGRKALLSGPLRGPKRHSKACWQQWRHSVSLGVQRQKLCELLEARGSRLAAWMKLNDIK